MAWHKPPPRCHIKQVGLDWWYSEVATDHKEVILHQGVHRTQVEALAAVGVDPSVPAGTPVLIYPLPVHHAEGIH